MRITFAHYGRENLGIEYLSAVLKQHGHTVALAYDPGLFSKEDNVFCSAALEKFFSREKEVIKTITESNPDLVAFSVYTSTYQWALETARQVKRKINVPVLFGGPHPTLVPEEVIKNNQVDFLIIGEGEVAILELVRALEEGAPLESVRNLCFKKSGGMIQNALAPPTDLNQLPFPDKDLFEKDIRYRDDYLVLASRGCPCFCSYCDSYLNKIYNGCYYRKRSVDSVMDELRDAKERFHFKEVMFFDSILVPERNWLNDLMSRYRKEITVPFKCFGHTNFFDLDMARLFKNSGCYCIDFGVQTVNQDIRKKVLYRKESDDQIKKAFKACDEVNLRYDIGIMLGLPFSREEDYQNLLGMIRDLRCLNRIKCHYLTYFPKSPIVQISKDAGLLDDKDLKNISAGIIGDFFHYHSIKNQSESSMVRKHMKLYKIFPILPNKLKQAIADGKSWKVIAWLPEWVIKCIQVFIGLRNNDIRFTIYLKKYAHAFVRRFLFFL